LWFGLGMAYGFPNIASGIVAAKLGPLAFEASLTVPNIVYIDAYWRLGITMPLPLSVQALDRIELGLHGGQRTQILLLFEGQEGPSFALTADGYLSQAPQVGAVMRLSLGIDCYTDAWGYHGSSAPPGCLPSVQVGAVVTFGE
jgi:hypothetical protein